MEWGKGKEMEGVCRAVAMDLAMKEGEREDIKGWKTVIYAREGNDWVRQSVDNVLKAEPTDFPRLDGRMYVREIVEKDLRWKD